MKTTSKTIDKLTRQRAALTQKIGMIDAAIKAESKKLNELNHRDALALLHKSGVLNDPERLRALLGKAATQTGKTAKGAAHVEL